MWSRQCDISKRIHYILIHQTCRIVLMWHYFVEFIIDVVHDFGSSLRPDVGRGSYTYPTCPCFIMLLIYTMQNIVQLHLWNLNFPPRSPSSRLLLVSLVVSSLMSTWFLWWPLTESHHNVCDFSAVDFVNLNSNFKDSLFDIIIDNTDAYQQYVHMFGI